MDALSPEQLEHFREALNAIVVLTQAMEWLYGASGEAFTAFAAACQAYLDAERQGERCEVTAEQLAKLLGSVSPDAAKFNSEGGFSQN